jgi:transposase
MVSQEYTYAYAAASASEGKLDSLILPYVNSACMQVFLEEVASRHPDDRVVMVLHGAGWHKAKSLTIPANLRSVFLPPYSPELNPAENLWDDLREKAFRNRVFASIQALENHLAASMRDMELQKERVRSIVAWPWIIN